MLSSDTWLWVALQGQADSVVLQFSQSLLETAVAPLMSPGFPYSGGSLESFVVLDSNSGFHEVLGMGLQPVTSQVDSCSSGLWQLTVAMSKKEFL